MSGEPGSAGGAPESGAGAGASEMRAGASVMPPGETAMPPSETVMPSGASVMPPGETVMPPGDTMMPSGASVMRERPPLPRSLLVALAAVPLVVLFALALARGLGGQIDDYDELWHLATGRLIVESGSVPREDPFTFTAGETPWINTNWLAQVVLWLLYRAGGIELDWLLGLALLLGAVAVTLRLAARQARSPWAALPVSLYVFLALETGSTVRPQGWSFLLLAVTFDVLERTREAARRALLPLGAALGAVLALAVQLHGEFVLAFVAVGLAAGGELWDLACRDERARGRRVGALACALGIGGLGVLLHPHGVESLLHPLRYATAELRLIHEMVQELRPPDYAAVDGHVVEAAILALLALALVARPRFRTEEILASLFFADFAWRYSRGIHPFAIALAGPFAHALGAALAPPRGPFALRLVLHVLARGEPAARAFVRLGPWALGLAFGLVALASVPELSPGKPGDTSSRRLASHADVAAAASFLASWDPPGEVWNEPEQGGALIFRLYPARRVFIDGRGDLHARSGAWEEFAAVWDVREDADAILRRRGCDVALVTRVKDGVPTPRLYQALADSRWIVAFEPPSGSVAVLVRPGSRAARSLEGRR